MVSAKRLTQLATSHDYSKKPEGTSEDLKSSHKIPALEIIVTLGFALPTTPADASAWS